MSVKDTVQSKEEKPSFKEEKREWSPGVDEIMSKISAGIQRTKMKNSREQWNKSKSKDWDKCWDFQSKAGCRKGERCKWKHVLSPSSTVPFAPQVPHINEGRGYFQGNLGQHRKVDTHYVNPYAPMVPPGLATLSANFDHDVVAPNFKPNVEAKEFLPKGKTNFDYGLSKYYRDLTNVSSQKIKENQMLTEDNQVQVAQGEGYCVQKDTTVSTFQDDTVDMKTRSSNPVGSDSTAEILLAQNIPKFAKNDSKEITRTITTGGKIVGSKNNENGNSAKARGRIEKVKGTPSKSPRQPLNFVVKKNSKRASRKSLSHWADAMSPLKTPHFQNLPMPPLESVTPLLSGMRGAFSPKQKHIMESDPPPPLLAKMIKRSESFARLRKKLGMKGLGEMGPKRMSSFPKVLAGADGRSSPISRQTDKNLAMYDTEHNRRLLMDRAFIKSQYMRLIETGKFMRGDPWESSQAVGSIRDSGSNREGLTSKLSPIASSSSDHIHPSDSLREITTLPATKSLTTQECTLSRRKNVDHKPVSQSMEVLRGKEHNRNYHPNMRKVPRTDTFSPLFPPSEVKSLPRTSRGYKLKNSMRGYSSKMSGFAGSRGRGAKGVSRFPKRQESLGSRRAVNGRRFYRGGRPRIASEQQIVNGSSTGKRS